MISLSPFLSMFYMLGWSFFNIFQISKNGWIFSGQLDSPGELHPILENQSRGIEKEGLMNNGRLEMRV